MTARRPGYRITDDADADLRGIATYVARDRPRSSRAILSALRETFGSLANSPQLGERCEHLGAELRRFSPRRPARSYVVYYRDATGGMIDIVGVIHGAQDQEEALHGR